MSVQNADRFIRFMEADAGLREKVAGLGRDGDVEALSAEAGASCSAHEVVLALNKRLAKDD